MKIRLFVLLLLFFSYYVFAYANEKFVKIDDVKFRYELQGEGPAVVLIHGWGVSLESWHFLFPALTDNYTVLRYDRRGFGKSDSMPDLSSDPTDLHRLLDYLKIDQAVILGHSQGGEVALRFALTYPERIAGLVLFGSAAPDGFGLPWNGNDALPLNMEEVARKKGMDSLRAMFSGHALGDGFVEGTEGLRIMSEMFQAYEGKDLLSQNQSLKSKSLPSIARLSEISVNTLVITGELEMPYFQIVSDALAYGIPNSERVIVKGGGHSLMLQQPERFNAEIKRYLKKIYDK